MTGPIHPIDCDCRRCQPHRPSAWPIVLECLAMITLLAFALIFV